MKRLWQIVVMALAVTPSLSIAQSPSSPNRIARRPVSHNTVQQIEALRPSLSRHAAIIFSGKVIDVLRIVPGAGAAQSSVQITFTVDTAVRGIITGDQFCLREWPGLWQAGERYRVGERYLLFLHAPNAAGLTSPVGGDVGRFLLDSNGTIDFSSLQPRRGPSVASTPNSSPVFDAPQPRTALPHKGLPYVPPRVLPE